MLALSINKLVRKWWQKNISFLIGAVHKRRPQSGGICLVRTFCGQGGGFFRCGRLHFLVQKTSDFSKFMVCPHGQERRRGWTSADKRWGVNFSRFCADVFYGRPLTWKRRFIIKQLIRSSSWDRANVRIWGRSRRRHKGSGGRALALGDFYEL